MAAEFFKEKSVFLVSDLTNNPAHFQKFKFEDKNLKKVRPLPNSGLQSPIPVIQKRQSQYQNPGIAIPRLDVSDLFVIVIFKLSTTKKKL